MASAQRHLPAPLGERAMGPPEAVQVEKTEQIVKEKKMTGEL